MTDQIKPVAATTYLPPDLKQALKIEAFNYGLTLSEFICKILKERETHS
jgi:hypothetical protein